MLFQNILGSHNFLIMYAVLSIIIMHCKISSTQDIAFIYAIDLYRVPTDRRNRKKMF